MKPEAVKKAWDGIVTKGNNRSDLGSDAVFIKNINGKPTAVTSKGEYSLTQTINGNPIVTTGEYNIPDFETGNTVKGNLQINMDDARSLLT